VALRRRRRQAPTLEQVRREVYELGWWYQDFAIPPGVRTGFGSPLSYDPQPRWELMEPFVPGDLTGMSVLDLGGSCGFFSIQMLMRGAKRCVLVEPVLEFAKQARYAAGRFGFRPEIITEDVHAYCLTSDEHFDYVLCLGLFYHLRYPNLVLDRLAEMTNRRLYLQSALIGPEEDFVYDRDDYGEQDAELLLGPVFPKLVFVERLYHGDATNWWIPNFAALSALVRAAGMEIITRPHPQLIVADPVRRLGTVSYRRLVFPRYGKVGFDSFPGSMRFKRPDWEQLLATRTEPLEQPPRD
jgi:tRNA (mo5U34)-methyltransferase